MVIFGAKIGLNHNTPEFFVRENCFRGFFNFDEKLFCSCMAFPASKIIKIFSKLKLFSNAYKYRFTKQNRISVGALPQRDPGLIRLLRLVLLVASSWVK